MKRNQSRARNCLLSNVIEWGHLNFEEMAMEATVFVDRLGDMHPTRALRVRKQSDGDIIVAIVQEGWPLGDPVNSDEKSYAATVEFCSSGGRSPEVRQALFALYEAMERENTRNPIPPP